MSNFIDYKFDGFFRNFGIYGSQRKRKKDRIV